MTPKRMHGMEVKLYMAIDEMYDELVNEGGIKGLQAWAADNPELCAALDRVQEILEPRVKMTEGEAYAAAAGRSTLRRGYGGE